MQKIQDNDPRGKTYLDESDHNNYVTEYSHYKNLMSFISTDKKFKVMINEAPGLIQHLSSYECIIQRKLDVCKWKPAKSEYSCDDLCTLQQVTNKKKEIWDSFAKFQQNNWEDLPAPEKNKLIEKLSKALVEFLTKFTDYMANEKIPLKDMAISRQFLEPFKWDNVLFYSAMLGSGAGLLTCCLGSDQFWTGLEQAH